MLVYIQLQGWNLILNFDTKLDATINKHDLLTVSEILTEERCSDLRNTKISL